MPLRYAIRMDQAIEVRQSFDSPTVYLDHWAVRLFSEDEDLRRRFVVALHNAGGTLFLSHHNFAEFVGPNDAKNAVYAEQFLEEVLPNIYIAELNIDKAIKQEQNYDPRNRAQRLSPPPDVELLRLIALQRPAGSRPFTIKGLLTEVAANRDRLGKAFRETNKRIADAVNTKRQRPEFVQKALKFEAKKDRARTLVIMEELLRNVILDATAPFTESDAADYQHAIIPTSYCDYVLLDGRWKDMIQRMERRITKLQLKLPHARCFSGRGNDLEELLIELESFNTRHA